MPEFFGPFVHKVIVSKIGSLLLKSNNICMFFFVVFVIIIIISAKRHFDVRKKKIELPELGVGRGLLVNDFFHIQMSSPRDSTDHSREL